MIEEILQILEDRMNFISSISKSDLNPIQQKLKETYEDYLSNNVKSTIVERRDDNGNIFAYEGHFEEVKDAG